MTDLLEVLRAHAEPFLGVHLRVFGVFVLTPVLGGFEIPTRTRAQVSFLLAAILYPVVAPRLPPVPTDLLALGLHYVGEFTIGFLIGLVVLLLFTAFQLAGEFYSLQMGFGIINVVDPLSQSQVPILGSFKATFAIALFLLTDGPRVVIEALARSFEVLPGLGLAAAGPVATALLRSFAVAFETGLRLAAPLMAIVFLVELLMGILAKTAPQMNVMVVGFQIKITAGLVALAFFWPVLWKVGGEVFDQGYRGVEALVRGAGAAVGA